MTEPKSTAAFDAETWLQSDLLDQTPQPRHRSDLSSAAIRVRRLL
jgi:hypothetical protein